MKKTAIYARSNNEHDLVTQISELLELAAQLGVKEEDILIFDDVAAGNSLEKPNPGFAWMLRQVHKKRIDTILVTSPDRISRNRYDVFAIAINLQLGGAQLIASQEILVSLA